MIGLTAILASSGLLAAGLIGALPLIFAGAILILGLAYNWKLKESGLLGNLLVSTSVGATFAFGGAAVGDLNGVVLTFAAMAFTFDLGEEIAADAMDVEGDKERSVRSLAITRGRSAALRVSASLFGLFIMLTFLPYLIGWLGIEYLVVIAATNAVLALLVIDLLRSQSRDRGRKLIRWMYLTATVMVIAFVIARLIVS